MTHEAAIRFLENNVFSWAVLNYWTSSWNLINNIELSWNENNIYWEIIWLEQNTDYYYKITVSDVSWNEDSSNTFSFD